MKNALIIFIKNPALGKVKTRIARTAGDEKALDIYLELTKITRENAEILRGPSQSRCLIFFDESVFEKDCLSSVQLVC